MILVYLFMACFAIVLVGAMVWCAVHMMVEIRLKFRELIKLEKKMEKEER